MEIIGWIGSILLTICAVPLAFECYKQKHANGMPTNFLLIWLFGEIFTLIYVLSPPDLPLIVNYAGNTILLCIVMYYKYYGKNK